MRYAPVQDGGTCAPTQYLSYYDDSHGYGLMERGDILQLEQLFLSLDEHPIMLIMQYIQDTIPIAINDLH